jgi:hypothetical protein
MNETLELVEVEEETKHRSPILHLFCMECDKIAGECKGFCGISLSGNGTIYINPAPSDKCVMCIEVRDSIEPGMCPKGHQIRGILI